MAQDPYDLCPCGSGKKLKFCCQAIAQDMEHVATALSKNQPRMALQKLEKLREQHPDNAWVLQRLTLSLLDDRRYAEAKTTALALLETAPDNSFGTALLAIASLAADGYEASRPAIYRAFQNCSAAYAGWMSGLATSIAAYMVSVGEHMALREYLSIALRLAPQESKQDCFVRLLEFESARDIPYPLRSVHNLINDELESPEDAKEFARGRRLAEIGCFGAADVVFSRLTQKLPENGAMWANAGLCRAWDGEALEAAKALQNAAQFLDDREQAVECATIAQLVAHDDAPVVLEIPRVCYAVQSLSKLISALSDHDSILTSNPPSLISNQEVDYVFDICEGPLADGVSPSDYNLDDLTSRLAEVACFDAQPDSDQPARAVLYAISDADLNAARALFEEAVGELIEEVELPSDDAVANGIDEFVNVFDQLLQPAWNADPSPSLPCGRRLRQQKFEAAVEEWLAHQLPGLDGKTPLECVGDASMERALLASVHVLDAYADRHQRVFNMADICQRLELQPLPNYELSSDQHVSGLSAMQMTRLDVHSLDDTQLSDTIQRAMLLSHREFLYLVLNELMQRPHLLENLESDRMLMTLAGLCRDRGDRDQAIKWIKRGAELQDGGELSEKVSWLYREAALRLESPSDTEIPNLLTTLWDKYGPKFDSLRESLQSLVAAFDFDPPWTESRIITADTEASGSADETSILTSEAGGEPGTPSKLWLPGQD